MVDPVVAPQAKSTSTDEEEATNLARHREAIREGISAAIPSMLISLAIGAVLLLPMIYLMRDTLTAAEEGLKDGTEVSYEPYMPGTLFAMFGGLFGLVSGWRMTTSTGLTGRPAWTIGASGIMVLLAFGAVAGLLSFAQAIPIMFWVCLAVLAVVALVGISYFTLWGAG
jgi:hypothetical protein